MKHRTILLVVIFLIMYAGSCEEPKTTITNIVHTDGSVLRKLEIRFPEKNLKISDVQVPYDSTWTIRDSLEINAKGDSTWVRRAEKLFRTVEGINSEYKADSSMNRDITRRAEFSRKFRWFTTEFRYDEIIDKKMKYGFPVRDFLNSEELKWFYSPDDLNDEKKNGPDSLRYRAFDDTVKKRLDRWTLENLVSEWVHEFAGLTLKTGNGGVSLDSLKMHENEYYHVIEKHEKSFDSLWANGTILREMIGPENALKFKTEADSAIKIATDRCFVTFSSYTVRTLMPGKLTTANSFIDSSGFVTWPVKSDYFLTETYDMKAESNVINRWAWVVSGLFLLFVITGIVLRKSRGGRRKI